MAWKQWDGGSSYLVHSVGFCNFVFLWNGWLVLPGPVRGKRAWCKCTMELQQCVGEPGKDGGLFHTTQRVGTPSPHRRPAGHHWWVPISSLLLLAGSTASLFFPVKHEGFKMVVYVIAEMVVKIIADCLLNFIVHIICGKFVQTGSNKQLSWLTRVRRRNLAKSSNTELTATVTAIAQWYVPSNITFYSSTKHTFKFATGPHVHALES